MISVSTSKGKSVNNDILLLQISSIQIIFKVLKCSFVLSMLTVAKEE